jgi:hypothetical protein
MDPTEAELNRWHCFIAPPTIATTIIQHHNTFITLFPVSVSLGVYRRGKGNGW